MTDRTGLSSNDREVLVRSLRERAEWADPILLRYLTPRDRKILLLRSGVDGAEPTSIPELSRMLGVTRQRLQQLEERAWAKIEDEMWRALRSLQRPPAVDLSEALESVRRITPELLGYLRQHTQDLQSLQPDVFEQLIAELLAGVGWEDVRLVGRDPRTSADILAGHYCSSVGARIRVFVETKRWRGKVGVEVFNSVLGAMISERDTFGWHQAWIVALGGAATTRKLSPEQWHLKGVEVKDSVDITRWLAGYRPNALGLWLPRESLSRAT